VLFSAAIKISGSHLNLFQLFWNCRFIEILLSLQGSRSFAIIFWAAGDLRDRSGEIGSKSSFLISGVSESAVFMIAPD
jgi:hypothetical protein